MKNPEIDGTLYPDEDVPHDLNDPGVAADYLHRVCGAYDFGIPPTPGVVATLRQMRPTFDEHPVLGSVGYHALRRWFGWEELPSPVPPPLKSDQRDFLEGRDPDPILI